MQDKEKDQKGKALQLTIDKLEKTYGKGAIMKLSDEKEDGCARYANWFYKVRPRLRGGIQKEE